MNIIPLTDDGAYICSRIAREYGLKAGDELSFSPYDSNEHYTVPDRRRDGRPEEPAYRHGGSVKDGRIIQTGT